MADSDYELEAVKIAGEWNKQLSLWATGSIVLSITFMKDILGGTEIATCSKIILVSSWVSLAASILVGNFAYGAPLTGAGQTDGWKLRVNASTRNLSILQAFLFVGGIALLILFAGLNIPHHLPGSK